MDLKYINKRKQSLGTVYTSGCAVTFVFLLKTLELKLVCMYQSLQFLFTSSLTLRQNKLERLIMTSIVCFSSVPDSPIGTPQLAPFGQSQVLLTNTDLTRRQGLYSQSHFRIAILNAVQHNNKKCATQHPQCTS